MLLGEVHIPAPLAADTPIPALVLVDPIEADLHTKQVVIGVGREVSSKFNWIYAVLPALQQKIFVELDVP